MVIQIFRDSLPLCLGHHWPLPGMSMHLVQVCAYVAFFFGCSFGVSPFTFEGKSLSVVHLLFTCCRIES